MYSDYAIYIRGKDGVFRNRLIDITSLSIIEVLNDVGSWTLKSTTQERCPFQVGDGIVIYKDGDYYYSGPVKKMTEEYDGYKELYIWTIQGTSDLDYLNRRVCYPDPETGDTTTVSHYTDTGALSQVVARLINKNMGADAMEDRKEPLFSSVVYDDDGDEVSVSLRFQTLLKGIQTPLDAQSFSITPLWDADADKLSFVLRKSNDKSNLLLFSTELNSLVSVSYLASAPTGNFIVSGGQGELTERSFAYAENSSSMEQWGRIEYFHDVRSVDDTDLQEDADLTLEKYAQENIGFSAELTAEGAYLRYRTDWNLGDYVGIVAHGQTYIRRIMQVKTDLTHNMETVSPTVGTVERGQLEKVFEELNRLRSDMDYLQWSGD